MDTIHKRIKARREELKMSLKDFAREVGVGYQAVQQWETDPDPDNPKVKSTAPKRTRLAEVARVLRVSETWLLTGKAEEGEESPVIRQLTEVAKLLPPEMQDFLAQQANSLYTALNPDKRSKANPFAGKTPPRKKVANDADR